MSKILLIFVGIFLISGCSDYHRENLDKMVKIMEESCKEGILLKGAEYNMGIFPSGSIGVYCLTKDDIDKLKGENN